MLLRKSVVSAFANYYITINDDLEVHLYGLNGTTPVFDANNMSDANMAVKYFENHLEEGKFDELQERNIDDDVRDFMDDLASTDLDILDQL
tara:strand:+ start:106 stop:378 length:273 start_codon:yes stop_codon:yes gene_type:complete